MDKVKITVSSAKLTTEAGKDVSKQEAIDYAVSELEECLGVFDISPITAEITLSTEGSQNDPVQKVNIKVNIRGNVIKQSAHSRQIKKAIDRAIPELQRQIRKYKTKKIEKPRRVARGKKYEKQESLDMQELMDDMNPEIDVELIEYDVSNEQ